MAIQYPTAGSIYYTQFAPTNQAAILSALSAALVSCGWDDTGLSSQVIGTFTGIPSNNQTITLDGSVYTWKDTINNGNPNEIDIGATSGDCARNLMEAITAGAGAGTDYSTATTAHTTLTASYVGSVVTISSIAANDSFTVSHAMSNFSFDQTTSYGQGYQMLMPATPQGLRGGVILDVVPGWSGIRLRLATADFTTLISGTATASGTTGQGVWFLASDSGYSLEFCGCAHQFFVFLLGDTTTSATRFFMSVPYIRDAHVPMAISAVDRSGGGEGAANGFWTITVVDTTSFTLDGASPSITIHTSGAHGRTTGDQIFISDVEAATNSGVFGLESQIARCMFAFGGCNGQTGNGWRQDGGRGVSNHWVCLNQFYHGQSSGLLPLERSFSAMVGNPTGPMSHFSWGGYADLEEPRVAWNVASTASTMFKICQLWAAFIVGESMPMDRLNTGFDGHNWIQYINNDTNNNLSLWLAKS